MERKAGSVCLVFPLWGLSVKADSQVQPSEPRLSRCGMGPRSEHFSKHSGDGGTHVPKARRGKATQRF